MPLGSCRGFVFVLFLTLISTIYPFHGFFHVCFKHPCFSYFEKTNQTTNSKPFTQSCVHSVSHRVSFFPFTVKFLKKKKKKSLVFTILQRPPFCLKLKGPWWHPSGQTQWSFPSTVSIFEPHRQALLPVARVPSFLYWLLFRLPTAGLPPSQALALCSFSACKSLICTWDSLFSWSGLWNRSELHFQTWWQLGFRKTSQGGSAGGGQMVWEARESSGYRTTQLLLALLRSPLFGHIHLLGFLTTLVPKVVME